MTYGYDDKSDKLKRWILTRFDQMKAERLRTEGERWEAYGMMHFRTDNDSKYIKPVHLYETDHITAWDTMVNGIMANLCSPNNQWFKLTMRGKRGEESDEIAGANDWMEDSEQRLLEHFNDTHFYPEAKLAMQDATCGGTSFEMIIDDVKGGRIIHDCVDPQECYIDEDYAHVVDTFFRDFEMTARQAIAKFGDELPDDILDLRSMPGANGNDNLDTKCEFLHAIFPVSQLPDEYRFSLPRIKRFASVWYSYKGNAVFHVGGFNYFPVAVHRFMRNDRTPYGQGIIMRIMTDLKQYQHLVLQDTTGIDLLSSPPLAVPAVLKGKFNYRPGAVNYMPNLQQGVPTPVKLTYDVQSVALKLEAVRQRIQKKLFNDLFEMEFTDDVQRTKFEVSRIEGRRLMLLSAIIGNIQTEMLNPLVEDTLAVMIMRGDTLPIPEELVKKVQSSDTTGVHVELNGLLAQNLRAYQQTIGLEDGISAIATMMNIYPASAVNFDFDKISRKYASSKQLPQDCILELPEVKKRKEAQAQQQQAQNQQQQMLNAAKAAKDLGMSAEDLMANQQGGTQAQQIANGGV